MAAASALARRSAIPFAMSLQQKKGQRLECSEVAVRSLHNTDVLSSCPYGRQLPSAPLERSGIQLTSVNSLGASNIQRSLMIFKWVGQSAHPPRRSPALKAEYHGPTLIMNLYPALCSSGNISSRRRCSSSPILTYRLCRGLKTIECLLNGCALVLVAIMKWLRMHTQKGKPGNALSRSSTQSPHYAL